jgi:CheY-like chemotaxis protein
VTPVALRRHPSGDAARLSVEGAVRIAGVRVLVVDDEPDARALVRRLLENCDAVVTTAGSAAEAYQHLRETRFDVLVSDIGMPGEDGYALIRRVRALGPDRGGNTPALALTAYARAEDRMKAVLAGFQMHVANPVEPAELITMVASLAGRA